MDAICSLGLGVFDDWFGKGRVRGQAQKAELRGDVPKAIELWVQAGKPDEAARLMVTRGDAEPDPKARLLHYTQAAKLAPEGTEANKLARKRRAEMVIALSHDAAVSAVARRDVLEAAADLEAVGELRLAAKAYKLGQDKEGEARCLTAAGEIEELENLLSDQQFEERMDRQREGAQADVELMVQSGRRRDALERLEQLLSATPDDHGLRERTSGLRSRRVIGPLVYAVQDGARRVYVLGDEVVVGRTEGTLTVPSSAVSRQHLRVFRKDGEIWVQDLGSRNGTQLRGINLAGPMPVHEEMDLKLGKEVPIRLRASTSAPGAIEIELGGERYVAFLGPGRAGELPWGFAMGHDGWVELVSSGESPAYVGEIAWVPRATLLVGDALASVREGEPELKILGA